MRKLLLVFLVLLLALPAVSAQVPGGDGKCRDAAGAEIPCDTDGDGIPDPSDSCPNESGPVDNRGCPVAPPTATAVPPQPEQPQPEQPQPEQPQNPSTAPLEPTVVPPAIVNLPLLNSTGNCVTATADATAVNLRKTPSTQGEVTGRLNPELVYRIYATLETDEGLWYLLRGGWAASWVMRQGGECEQVPGMLPGDTPLEIADTNPGEAGLLLPAVQKVREAAARMKVNTSVEEIPFVVLDVDPEGEWWVIIPDGDGRAELIVRINGNNEPASFYAFDAAFLGGVNVREGYVGGVFVGYYHDTDPTDNAQDGLAELITQTPGSDPTAAQADYYLKLDGVDGEAQVFPLPEPNGILPPGTTQYGIYLGADGQFWLSSDETEGGTDDIPFGGLMFFDIGPGTGPTEALKGKPMHLVNNTAAHDPNDDSTYMQIELENSLVTSYVFNLPERSVAGWMYPDPTTGALRFAVKDAEGTEHQGVLMFDEEGDLVFVPEGTEGADQKANWDLVAAKKAFYFVPPAEMTPDLPIVIADDEDSAAGGHVKVFDGQTGGLLLSLAAVDDPDPTVKSPYLITVRKAGGGPQE